MNINLKNYYSLIYSEKKFVRDPLLSVILVCYNHREYLEESLQSILKSKTNFKFEILITDDCSNDNSIEILKLFQLQNPTSIKLLLSNVNLSRYGSPGSLNSQKAYLESKGKYIALLEGDDYWTDPYKLQKQVDFMQNNPAYAMSFHDRRILYHNKANNNGTLLPEKMKKTLSHQDLIMCKIQCPPTCTLMFRKTSIHPLPDWFAKIVCGDRMLSIISTQKGLCGYIPDIEPSVYRVHDKSITQGLNKTISSLLDVESRFQIMKLDQEKVSLDYHLFKINQILKILISDYKFLTFKQKIKTTVLLAKFFLKKPGGIVKLLTSKKN